MPRAELTSGRLGPGDDLSEWEALVSASPQGAIFSRWWWLQAVCPNAWTIHTLRRDGDLVAGIALHTAPDGTLRQPPLTQVLGPILTPSRASNPEKVLSWEMEQLTALAEGLPTAPQATLHWHPQLTNWLPFHWAGWSQTTRYTYAFDDLSDLKAVFARFAHAKRKNLKKAAKLVEVRADMDPAAFRAHQERTLGADGQAVHYSAALFERVHAATVSRGQGRTWYAVDGDGVIHAAIFVVWDENSAYYLISSIDADHRNSGAATLLVKTAIEHVAPLTRRFDFEGSMIPGVERSFRKFGATQTPYFRVWRDDRAPVERAKAEAMRYGRRALGRLRRLADRR